MRINVSCFFWPFLMWLLGNFKLRVCLAFCGRALERHSPEQRAHLWCWIGGERSGGVWVGSVAFRDGLGQASRGGDRQCAPARGNFNPKKSPVVHIDKTERYFKASCVHFTVWK